MLSSSCLSRLLLFAVAFLAGCAGDPALLRKPYDSRGAAAEPANATVIPLGNGRRSFLTPVAGGLEVSFEGFRHPIRLSGATNPELLRIDPGLLRTDFLIATREPGCAKRVHFFSASDAGVSHWVLGDCQSAPHIVNIGDQLLIDFDDGYTVWRYAYSGGRLAKSEFLSGSPLATVVRDYGVRRHIPVLPFIVDTRPRKVPSPANAGSTGSAAGRPSPPRAPTSARPAPVFRVPSLEVPVTPVVLSR